MGFFSRTKPASARAIETALDDYAVTALQSENGSWQIQVELHGDADPAALEAEMRGILTKNFGLKNEVMMFVFSRHKEAPVIEKTPTRKPSKIDVKGVKKIIAVASGKGGVGKSTVSAGIACALAAQGLKVGLLDADIYGPSLPKLMGLEGNRPGGDEDGILPLSAHGLSVMSIGFMVDPAKALIWRGPMVQSAFRQLLSDVVWDHDGSLDVLILDTPPGTGDVQLTLAQSLGIDGAVIVSSPQELALADARKGVQMFQTLNVPILGLVENMSGDVFGSGGGERAADDLNIPFLGRVALDKSIREGGDNGAPFTEPFVAIAHDLHRKIIA
jgi:ATP-binding protein involved in chromosome partitioning